jgi:hypothetical protein
VTAYVTEHSGAGWWRQVVNQAPLAAYTLSSLTSTGGTSSGAVLQSGTRYVRVTCDAGMYINNSTTSGALTLTATNSLRVPPNQKGEWFSVSTANRLQAQST